MPPKNWLFKSDPETYGIAELERDGVTDWDGVRNYRARNYMRDEMSPGDPILFYHSNADPTGVYGIAEVASEAYPERSQFDRRSRYFDPGSEREKPTWWCVDVRHLETFAAPVTRDELRELPGLADLLVLKRGMRLSITPVTRREFDTVVRAGRAKSKR
jgi:predicted RNA-binding protein with PUA-like domain